MTTSGSSKELICYSCGSGHMRISSETQQFAYRDGERDVLLTVVLPIEHCESCGESFVGADAEIAQHAAVCHYLGRLTPAEIRELRKSLRMNQADFAAKVGVGTASIKRWEAGNLIQSASMDRLLRSVIESGAQTSVSFNPVFRTRIQKYMIADSKTFELRAFP